ICRAVARASEGVTCEGADASPDCTEGLSTCFVDAHPARHTAVRRLKERGKFTGCHQTAACMDGGFWCFTQPQPTVQITIRLLASVLIFSASLVATQAAESAKRVALVIGN